MDVLFVGALGAKLDCFVASLLATTAVRLARALPEVGEGEAAYSAAIDGATKGGGLDRSFNNPPRFARAKATDFSFTGP